MSEQNPFNRQNIEQSAVVQAPGLLEQLGLPPDLIRFLRKNQRTIWIVVGIIVFIITAFSLYGSYRAYRDDKAASALTEAMKADGAKKQELLIQVADAYGSTSSGIWARVELARLATAAGEQDRAVEELYGVRKSLSRNNPAMPLLLYNLGALHESRNEPEQAISAYGELASYLGFEAAAYKAMGRVYEAENDREQALSMYRKYLAALEGDESGPGFDPDREMIEARINVLEN
ncbi:MAG TPA: tetratricopeptide repeat protein [Desulfobacteraceae bacterium]|nr:tetratricopeptide repeat protein [Desulfobacteraceae bacterium]